LEPSGAEDFYLFEAGWDGRREGRGMGRGGRGEDIVREREQTVERVSGIRFFGWAVSGMQEKWDVRRRDEGKGGCLTSDSRLHRHHPYAGKPATRTGKTKKSLHDNERNQKQGKTTGRTTNPNLNPTTNLLPSTNLA
jgi:hypothetical protein